MRVITRLFSSPDVRLGSLLPRPPFRAAASHLAEQTISSPSFGGAVRFQPLGCTGFRPSRYTLNDADKHLCSCVCRLGNSCRELGTRAGSLASLATRRTRYHRLCTHRIAFRLLRCSQHDQSRETSARFLCSKRRRIRRMPHKPNPLFGPEVSGFSPLRQLAFEPLVLESLPQTSGRVTLCCNP